jgi:hypothetical protein
VAITDIDKFVYASDDGTFVLTAGSNTPIGRVHRFISSGVAIVSFAANGANNAAVVALTDSTGATASNTLAATSGTDTLVIPCTLPAGTSAGDVITNYVLGYKFKILAWSFTTAVAGVGTGASRVFNMEIGTTDVGTVASTCTLTEASTSDVGEQTAGTTVTGANTGTAANTFSIEVASGGTAFTAGSGFFTILVQNMDTADTIASLSAKVDELIVVANAL